MPAISTYLRVRIAVPLKKYADDHDQTRGQAINDIVEKKLKREGYLDKQNV